MTLLALPHHYYTTLQSVFNLPRGKGDGEEEGQVGKFNPTG